MHNEMRCNFYLRFDRNFEFPLIFINLQIVASLAIDSRNSAVWAKPQFSDAKIPAARRRDANVPCRADPSREMSKTKALTAKFENEHENPANFQNSASYRFEFPWALLWDGPLYNSESKVERKQKRER